MMNVMVIDSRLSWLVTSTWLMSMRSPSHWWSYSSAGMSRSGMELISVARRGELIEGSRSVLKVEL